MKNILKSTKLADNWLLKSGIQNDSNKDRIAGSFNSWFDLESKRFSFAYSEITGYGINTLLYLHSKQDINKITFLNKSKMAADYLIKVAYDKKAGGILCRFDHNLQKFSSKVCTFDNAMCLNAIVNLYKVTKNKKYLDFAIKIANWIIKLQKKDGSFYSRYKIDDNEYEEKGNKWSTQSGSYHAKVAIGLINLGLLIHQEKFVKPAERICNWILRFQTPEGRFITDEHNKSTFLHPCCYAAEGLIVAGIALKNDRYVKAAKKAVEWILKNKLSTNGFPAYFKDNKFIALESPEINAQVLRLVIILRKIGEIEYDENMLKMDVGNILNYQSQAKTKETFGGFYSGDAWFYEDENKKGKHINSWVTMFTIQALIMYQKGFDKSEIFSLI